MYSEHLFSKTRSKYPVKNEGHINTHTHTHIHEVFVHIHICTPKFKESHISKPGNHLQSPISSRVTIHYL